MVFPAQAIPVGFSLGSVLCWCTSDFLGGYASKNANSVLVTAITNCAGLLAILPISWFTGSPTLALTNVAWALAGGACGGSALALFYRARSEEHTSELQSHSFISYAVFCLKKK